MESQIEDTLILRLPPRLAARIGARIDKYDRSRGDPGALLRRRRRKGKDGKDDGRQTLALIQAIWGEDGLLDYDNLNKAEDLLFLDGMDEQNAENEEEDPAQAQKEEREGEQDEVEDAGDCEVEYWRVEGKNYIFKYGEDEYYATLVHLPCIIEVQKSTDNANLYKTGDVGQMLLVHDVKVSSGLPRPDIDSTDMHGDVFAHGITPPMRRVAPDRFANVSSTARRLEANLTMDDVRRADDLLFEFKQLVLQKHRKVDAPAPNKQKKTGPGTSAITASSNNTTFVYEEIIDAEPWMEFADDVIYIEQGDDHFRSSTKKARTKALENKFMQEETRKNNMRATGAGSVPFDPIAAFRAGRIGGWEPQPLPSAYPSVSLLAPPTVSPTPVETSSSSAPPPVDQSQQAVSAPKSESTDPGFYLETPPESTASSPAPPPVNNSARIAELQQKIAEEELRLPMMLNAIVRERHEHNLNNLRAELAKLQEYMEPTRDESGDILL